VIIGLVDDDPSVLDMLENQIEYDSLRTTTDPDTAREWIQSQALDCLVTDLKLGDQSGMELLREARTMSPPIEVIMMTGYGSVESAVTAMKNGARDYLQKPVQVDELQLLLERVEDEIETRTQLEGFRAASSAAGDSLLVGDSDRMSELRDTIEKVAPERINVLIKGSTGTGKELIAREIHRLSPRSDAPFIAVNCAAIPENLIESELFGHVKGAFTGADETKRGKIELADGGTVFLDEIGEMPHSLQPKLLRVLEQDQITRVGGEAPQPVDVRFLSATNRDLGRQMDEEVFRKDLYFRLQGMEIVAPDLRDHPEDIPRLVQHFLDEMAGERFQKMDVEQEVYEALKRYEWPGNVRELRNVVERAAVLSDQNTITTEGLPPEVLDSDPSTGSDRRWWTRYGESLDDVINGIENEIIRTVVEEADGNKSEAARRLGISRQSLHYKLNQDE
jgi:DNA-binding NtrC family response regulator